MNNTLLSVKGNHINRIDKKIIMTKSKISPPAVYVYLDSKGIDTLFAQTVDEVVDEIKRSGDQTTGMKTRFKAALNILFGAEASAEGELSSVNRKAEEIKSHLATEQKLERVIKHLKQTDVYFEDLKDAATYCKKNFFEVNSVFLNTRNSFNAPQFFLGKEGVNAVNMSGTVHFEKGPSISEYSDEYFQAQDFRFVMLAGVDKFTRIQQGKMEAANHDAYMLAGGNDIRLNVFGNLRLKRIEYQIKPFAIWL